MLMRLRNKRAQSILEYAVIVGVVVAGLLAMQVYIKRGLEGKLRSSADDIGEQYAPGNTTGSYTTVTGRSATEVTTPAGVTTNTITRGTQTKTGSETVADLSAN